MSAALTACGSGVDDWNLDESRHSADRKLILERHLERRAVLPVQAVAEIPRAVGLSVADSVCAVQSDAKRAPPGGLVRYRGAPPDLRACLRRTDENESDQNIFLHLGSECLRLARGGR